ncbi:ABC-type multidrug transport system, ATPase and permease component [Anaerosporobacter mobilis DSM 15930]|uniref:ABC-type multidrug transport system, ATPase and permease component n=1 Tax=Anaerosporobacter mobilis DSM 15930 TaxID=1120996 RepID=A0A1M7GQ32_9FIRM|nr:ABC transporter ATP-binding protein [Anaerosporobacter mobilis]SHM17987.1 ABC-type multidrug transport system, ATPase and permease component [Anaerosporobacter mobilis DSM 15930]
MFKKLFSGIPKKLLIASIIFTLIWSFMNSYMTVALSKTTSAHLVKSEFIHAAIFFIVYILLWELLEFILDCMHGVIQAYVSNSSYDFYYEKLYYTKPESLQRGNTGYIAGILTQLIEKKSTLLNSLLLATVSVIYILYLMVYITHYSIWFSIIILVLSLLSIAIRMICSRFLALHLKRMTIVKGEQTRIFMDGINNISTVQKLRGLDFIMQKSRNVQQENLQATKRYLIGNELGFTLYKTVNYLLCPICMFVALALYKKNPSFPIVEFMSYLSLITIQLVFNNRNISGFIRDYNIFCASQREMDAIVREQSEIYTTTSISDTFHEIAVHNLEYQYDSNEEALTITIPEFHIYKGERICITGESGQGKTTILKILSGIIETTDTMFLDGKPLNKNIDAVYIAQDTEMLDLTLRENLAFGNKTISDEQLYEMLYAVGMSDWLSKQEKGLDTLLGERGVFISTGQRQRLNVVRGLLINKEIYFLDEPTSNVDDVTETKMIELIDTYLKGKTVIIVTHKEQICKICDRRYIFEENRMKECTI